MKKPLLNLDREFELMVKYQITVESKSVVVKNNKHDEFPYSLYEIVEPYPTYEEYLHCNEFDEGQLIMNSLSLPVLDVVQERRRKEFKPMLILA